MKYYLAIFLRHLPLFALVASIITVISVFVATSLPAVFSSQARFIMEDSQIPNAMAPPTVATPVRAQLQIFQQRLLARNNLLEIARKHQIYTDMNRLTPDQIVQAMEDDTTASIQMDRNGASILLIQFSASTARKAVAVVNDYVSIIQQLDLENRTGRAGQTHDFFRQEVRRLEAELANVSAQLSKFKYDNADALPEGQEFRLGQQSVLQERIAQSDREIATLTSQRTAMIEIFNSTGRIEGITGVELSPQQKELQSLRSQLNDALLVYAPGNPRIKMLELRIRQAEEQIAQQSDMQAAPASPLDLQLAEIDTRISALRQQKAESETALQNVNDAISRSTMNTIQLATMERDYANLQSQYNLAVNNAAQASTGERIEILSRGDRLTLLEQPIAPSRPSSPNRLLIAAAGTFLGIAAGIGLIVLIEILKTAPRRPEAIVRKLGITPLATLPYIQSQRELKRQRAITLATVAAILIAVPVLVWSVHAFYRPIDVLAEQIVSRVRGVK